MTQTLPPSSAAAHGPVAGAVKWAFKSYFRTRQAIDEVVAEARAEVEASKAADAVQLPPPIAGGSDERRVNRTVAVRGEPMAAPVRRSTDRMIVRWLTAEGVEEHPVKDVPDLLKRDDGYVWVDIPTFDAPAERLLSDVFEFHPLALRDCREPGHMPKVHAYDDHLFIVLHAPQRDEDGQVSHRELNQFVGRRYLVTVHERLGATPVEVRDLETTDVFDRIESGRARPSSSGGLSYAVATRLAVGMEDMVADLAKTVADLETAVSAHERHLLRRPKDRPESIVDEMFQLRHSLLAIETIADPNRVVDARAEALASRAMSRDERRLMEDVEDQFSRVRQLCRGQKELLQGVLDFSRTRTSAKMDLAMSRLALLSAVALPISIISSIYGMQLWVFTSTRLDILAALLVLMGVLTYGMLRWARGQGWW
jgi:Mg2+ and Co2+ transporter CorA